MILMHSTIDLKNMLSIMLDGLKSSKNTGIREYPQSDEKLIYFLALDEKLLINHVPIWGRYHFILNKDFVRDNSEQFRTHAHDYGFDHMFRDFVKSLRLKPCESSYGDLVRQVVSLKPVPREGLESIMLDKSVPEDERELIKVASPAQMKVYAQILFKKVERIK